MSTALTLHILHPGQRFLDELTVAVAVFTMDPQLHILNQLTDRCDGKPPSITSQPLPLGGKLYVSKDDRNVWVDTDHWDNRLTYVTAGDLKGLVLDQTATPLNLAIKAFINTLPDHTAIILYWY